MTNEWNQQSNGGNQGPGPEFNPGQPGPPNPYGTQETSSQPNPYPQQDPYAPEIPNHSSAYGKQQSAQSWQQNQPYEQGNQGQQFAAHQQAWSHQPPPGALPPRSRALGISGLVVVVLAAVALAGAAWAFGTGLAEYFLDLAGTGFPRDPDMLVNDPRTIAYAEGAAGVFVAGFLAGVVGLIGWIISIVATATRRGRTFGIVGIIVGILSIPLAYGVVLLVLNPVLAQLG
ncbi:MAG: DUF4064 domain-containing protein [Arachnia sp.]